MFNRTITADKAKFGTNLFDSELVGADALRAPIQLGWLGFRVNVPRPGPVDKQNAELTIRLRVCLNLIDPPGSGLANVRSVGGTACVADADGWLFPMVSWSAQQRKDFCDTYRTHCQSVWNDRYCLLTPDDYEGLEVYVRSGNLGQKVYSRP